MAPFRTHDKIKVLIVEDHPLVREGLNSIINNEPDMEVCAEADNSPSALSALEDHLPDFIIMDITLNESNGIDLIKQINDYHPDIPILVLSMHDEASYAERSMRAGAKGYIMKQEAHGNVITAIRKILKGDFFMSPAISHLMMSRMFNTNDTSKSTIELLSDREFEVFQMIGEGISTREIAERLHISIKTVETYRANIKSKLNISNGTKLMKYAVQWVSESHY